jgi:hypothetical protein
MSISYAAVHDNQIAVVFFWFMPFCCWRLLRRARLQNDRAANQRNTRAACDKRMTIVRENR